MTFSYKRKGLWLILGALILVLTACSSSNNESKKDDKNIELAYVEWDTEVASTHVLAKVLEDEGFRVKTTGLDLAIMWEAVANNKVDAMVAAWLPVTNKTQVEKYGDKMVDLGVNLEGAKLGLVVPSYMTINSIEDLKNQARKSITGIEPGAAIMSATEKAIIDYPNLDGWNIKSSSSGAMAVALGQAIKKKEDIIITGWSPHWLFNKYDLKYLEDPKKVYGDTEQIHSFASLKLQEKSPKAYEIIDKFNWEVADIEAVMLDISEGTSPEDAAEKWVVNNKDKVAEWTK